LNIDEIKAINSQLLVYIMVVKCNRNIVRIAKLPLLHIVHWHARVLYWSRRGSQCGLSVSLV